MISRSQNRQQVHCGYGLRKKKRAPHALCAILQSHEKTAGMVNHLKRHHGFLSKNNAWKDIILYSYFMQQFMSGRGGSGSTWGHVGSARVRSTSSRVEVDVGTPFKTSCRRSLVSVNKSYAPQSAQKNLHPAILTMNIHNLSKKQTRNRIHQLLKLETATKLS